MPDLISTVSNLLREAAETCVIPVFGKREANPKEKSPGEWVTEADKAGEAFLEPALQSLVPGSLVIGEEAASADPSVLDRLASDGNVWLIDPLDGTSNFAHGVPPFALMVALIHKGETMASWILDPVANQLSISEKGSGSWINGLCSLLANTAMGPCTGCPVPTRSWWTRNTSRRVCIPCGRSRKIGIACGD